MGWTSESIQTPSFYSITKSFIRAWAWAILDSYGPFLRFLPNCLGHFHIDTLRHFCLKHTFGHFHLLHFGPNLQLNLTVVNHTIKWQILASTNANETWPLNERFPTIKAWCCCHTSTRFVYITKGHVRARFVYIQMVEIIDVCSFKGRMLGPL